jgi:HlyD family secretion protein
VAAREGDPVTQGQLLARLDDASFVAAVDQAKAGVAQARVGKSEIRLVSAPAAREQQRQAEARLAQAEVELARTKNLVAAQVVPDAELSVAETTYALAQSQLKAAKLEVLAASGSGTQAQRAAAQVAQAEAQLAKAQADLSRTVITSPTAGVLLSRSIEPGDFVQPGAPIFVISATGRTRLVIEPDERSLASIRIGQPAKASAEAFPKQSFSAVVSYIAPAVDAKRGTIEVRLDVSQPPAYLRPDMTVSVEVELERKAAAKTLPLTAIHDVAKNPWVYAVENGQLERVAVKLGIQGDSQVEVLEGPKVGSKIVTDSAKPLVDGQRVQERH